MSSKKKNILKISKNWEDYKEAIGLCGVFCGGCPAFHAKRCHGCGFENRNQKRSSKWNCKKRQCVIDKEINNCGSCIEVGKCKIRKPLITNYKSRYNMFFWINPINKKVFETQKEDYDLSRYLDKKGFKLLLNKFK